MIHREMLRPESFCSVMVRRVAICPVMLRCLGWNFRIAVATVMFMRGISANEAVYSHAVVAADHPAASEAGVSILRQGGNVVDAAVATSLALSVTRPSSCGIGGGGFMVIWDAKSRTAVAIDYRERAPKAATREMFQESARDSRTGHNDRAAESTSVRGGKASGIPGTVAGLCHAAEKYGSLPLSTLVQPAIDLCRKGVEIDDHDIDVQRSTLDKIQKHADYTTRFSDLIRLYLNNGVAWKKGDRFYSPQLKSFEEIARHGAAAFTTGAVALAIVESSQKQGGILTLDDLASRVPMERPVFTGEFHGRTILTMPPPSSGGIALLQTLNTLTEWEKRTGMRLGDLDHNSAACVHTIAETLKHAFADRAEFLGDTDFVKVPVERLLSRKYAADIAAKIETGRTREAGEYGRFFQNPDAGTSHFSVIDRDGSAVACTETINLTFGSFVVVPEFGVILNNEMDDFSAHPGEANAFGLIQSEANVAEAGKKPLSSMTPTIVVRDGRAEFVCGASGGPRIITATLQVLLNHVEFSQTPEQAVASPRFHHQWFPNELLLERPLFGTASATMNSFGHKTISSSSLAAAQAVSRSSDGLRGGSDPRKGGRPAGY